MGWLSSLNPLNLISSAVSSIGNTVKSFTGSNDMDRMLSFERLKEMDNDMGMKMLEWKMSLSANGNWLTKSVRPVIAYSFIIQYWASKAGYVAPMTPADYEMFKVIVIFYFSSRGVEKIADKLLKLKKG